MSSQEKREEVRRKRNLVAKHNKNKGKPHKPKIIYKRDKKILLDEPSD